MKKILIFVMVIFSVLFINLSADATGIDIPTDEPYYIYEADMPKPTNSLLGNLELVDTILLQGNSSIGMYYNVYKYTMPIFVPINLNNDDYIQSNMHNTFVNLPAGSTYAVTFTEAISQTETLNQRVLETMSYSITSSLSAR